MDAKDPSPEADPAATPDATPEAAARRRIDAQLRQAGWQVQDRRSVQLASGQLAGQDGVGAAGVGCFGVAVRELPAAGGEADDGLFLGRQLVGVIEAKKLGSTLGGRETPREGEESHFPTRQHFSPTLPAPRHSGSCPAPGPPWPAFRAAQAKSAG